MYVILHACRVLGISDNSHMAFLMDVLIVSLLAYDLILSSLRLMLQGKLSKSSCVDPEGVGSGLSQNYSASIQCKTIISPPAEIVARFVNWV